MRLFRSLTVLAALAAIAPSQSSITTTFVSNNGGGAGWINLFDVSLNVGVAITAFDINSSTAVGTSGTIDVYVTAPGGTYVGNQTNPGVWMLAGSSQTFTTAGRDLPTNAPLVNPIILPPGTHGIAILYNGVSPAYTNGSGPNQTYSNPDMTLNCGSSVAGLFTGTLFDPRVWNGTIYYSVGGSFATATPYGTGCGLGLPASFYELFDGANPNDLPGTGITLNWTGQIYVITQGSNPIVTPSGAPTPFNDDDTQQITLPWAYPTQNGATNDIWVCSNGFVALEPTTITDFTESVAELLSGPMRFCPYWDDFNPGTSGGGSINLEQDPGNPALFHVTWTGVPEFSNTGANDLQLTLHQSGTAEFKWGAMSSTDGLVGYSPGNGVADPGATDVSAITALPLGTGRPALSLSSIARPILGMTAVTQTNDIPLGSPAGFIIYSAGQFDPGVNLGPLGAPGCFQYVGLDVAVLYVPTGPTQMHSFPLPNNPAFVGTNLYVQSAVADLNTNALGFITSNGIAWSANTQ